MKKDEEKQGNCEEKEEKKKRVARKRKYPVKGRRWRESKNLLLNMERNVSG